MKRKTALELYAVLNQLKGVKIKNPILAFAATKNKKKVEGENEAIQAASAKSDKFMKYLDERVESAKKIVGTENVVALQTGGFKWDIPKDKRAEMEKAEKKLENKHKEAIKEDEKNEEKIKVLLDENIDIELEKIKEEETHKDIKEGNLTLGQLEIMLPMLEE